ncbi:MAG TPA: RNA polymerase sigma factor [Pyrinomonadaceae bacterium]
MARSILQRIAAKDKTAAQECLNAYGGLVWSLARRMCRNMDDAEDAVQEIFIDIWKNAERFDETQASETTFVAMIARRRLIDRLRKSQRQPQIDSIEEMTIEPVKAQDKQMQTAVEAQQAAEALNALRPEQRQVLQLSIYQGMSHQEIADATGMPIGTVKSHARRGLMEIREVLGIDSSGKNETKGVVA